MGTVIVLLVLLAAVFFAVRSIVRDKKSGKACSSCGGGCSKCESKSQ